MFARQLSRRRLLTGGGALLAVTACQAPPPAPTAAPTAAPPVAPTVPPAASPPPASAASPTPAASPGPAASASPAAAPAPSPSASPSPAAAAPPRQPALIRPQLTIGTTGDITRLDPHQSIGFEDAVVTFNLFDTLVARRADNRLYPSLAIQWRLIGDRAWEFALRRDVIWHTGDPLTSADVAFSLGRTADPNTRSAVSNAFRTVERIETPDPFTVILRLRAPDPLLPARLASYGGQIVPKAYLQAVGPEQFNLKPVGSGPVRFAEWTKDINLVLEANPTYWGGRIAWDRVVLRPMPDPAARLAALQSGDIDLALRLPPAEAIQAAALPGATVQTVPANLLYVLGVNSKVAPLDDPRVKQALAAGIDRQSIIDTLWQGQGIVPNGPIPRGDFAYEPNRPPLTYDPTRAKQLLAAAGYDQAEIVFETTEKYLPNDRAMAEAIVATWRDIGVNVRLDTIDHSTRAEKFRDKTFRGLWWTDPASPLQDPDGMLWRLLAPGGPQDYWRGSPEFDQLGAEAQTSLDEARRLTLYHRMTDLANEHFPWLPVLQPLTAHGVSTAVEWTPAANGLVELRNFGLWAR